MQENDGLNSMDDINKSVNSQKALAEKLFNQVEKANESVFTTVESPLLALNTVYNVINTNQKLSSQDINTIKTLLELAKTYTDENIKLKIDEVYKCVSSLKKSTIKEEIEAEKSKINELLKDINDSLLKLKDEIRDKSIEEISQNLPWISEVIKRLEVQSASGVSMFFATQMKDLLQENMLSYVKTVSENIEKYIYEGSVKIENANFSKEPEYDKRPKIVIELPDGMTYGGDKKYTKIIFIEPRVTDVMNSNEYYNLKALAKSIDGILLDTSKYIDTIKQTTVFFKFIEQTSLLRNQIGTRLSIVDFSDTKDEVVDFFFTILLMFLKNTDFLKFKEGYLTLLAKKLTIANGEGYANYKE